MIDPTQKQLIALTALNAMLAQVHFSICCIDSVAKLLGVHPEGEAYNALRPLHCINYCDMPRELMEALPGLIKQCLAVEPTYQFRMRGQVVMTDQPPAPPRGIRRLLGRGG